VEGQNGDLRVTIGANHDTTAMNGHPWWALYTRHQHEKVVAEMLAAKGYEVFLPLYESTRKWKDRTKVLTLPLFPCYLFVRGALDRKLHVLTTPGVHMILSRGDQAAIVPDQEIESIQRAVDGALNVEPHPFLKCGTKVRVTRGALEGVIGILTRKKNFYRLILSVEMLAQSVSVEVSACDVEPVAESISNDRLDYPSGPESRSVDSGSAELRIAAFS
jgi:transcription antitermination factor NusG